MWFDMESNRSLTVSTNATRLEMPAGVRIIVVHEGSQEALQVVPAATAATAAAGEKAS
jgi:hypothetical protein